MKKFQVLAVFVAMTVIGSAFLAIGAAGASSPQTGSLSFNIQYVGGGYTVPANSSTVVMLETSNGHVISSLPGNSVTFPSLYYGNYKLVVPPQYLTGAHNKLVIINETSFNVTLNSTTNGMPFTESVHVDPTQLVKVTVSNLVSGSASISFKSLEGFTFTTASVTSSLNYVNNISLPVEYYAVVKSSGQSYTFLENSAGVSVTLNLSSGIPISGFVSAKSGAKISTVDITIINGTSNNYTTTHFTGNSFSVYAPNWKGDTLIISSPGYNSSSFSGSKLQALVGNTVSVQLVPSNSTVAYRYELSADLKTLTLTETYSISNNTTIPQFGNSSVGSLYWQLLLDGINSEYINSYINSTILNYTANSFLVNGVYYNITPAGYTLTPVTPFSSTSPTKSGFTATITATYTNVSSIKTSIYNSAFTIKVYAIGTQYLNGALKYSYNIVYHNTSVALNSSSASNVKLSDSPIFIPAQSSNGFVTLTLVPVSNASITNSQIQFKIYGLVVNNILNSTQSNTIFVVPHGIAVNVNISNGFYNPVTGTNDYQNSNFTWTITGSTTLPSASGSNLTQVFNSGLSTVNVSFISGSGVPGNTTFYVYGFNSTPTVVYNITSQGETIMNGTASTSSIGIFVNQTQTTDYSSYYSSLNVSVKGMQYQVPLAYNWSFPSSVSLSANTSYLFQKPFLTEGYQYAYLNVSSVSGNASVKFIVTVNDTTPPVPIVTIKNSKGQVLSSPISGQTMTLTANSSYDPYYNSTYLSAHNLILNYTWKIESSSGTVLSQSPTTYKILNNGSAYDPTIKVQFLNTSSIRIALSIRNPSNITGTNNNSYAMVIDSPLITINSIYLTSGPQQGISSTIYVNFTNTGTVTANNVTISISVGGTVVATQTFTYLNLTSGSSANESLTWTPGSSGSLGIVVTGNANGEYSFMIPQGEYSSTISVSPSPYTTPLIIGGVIAIIVVIGFVYFRLTSRGSKTTAIKKRDDSKKQQPPEKKK